MTNLIYPHPTQELVTTTRPFTTLASSSIVNMTDFDDPSQWTWNEVVASTEEEWVGFYVHFSSYSSARSVGLLATGTAGNEQIIAFMPVSTGINTAMDYYVPVSAPAGTRLSMAVAQNALEGTQIRGVPKSKAPYARSFSRFESGPFTFENNFFDQLDLDSGGVANTKTAWTEITTGQAGDDAQNYMDGASLNHVYDFIALCATASPSAYGNSSWVIDLATGSAGQEEVFLENLLLSGNSYDYGYLNLLWLPWGKPAGTRVSIRFQTHQTNATDSARFLRDVFLCGVR